ncbi:G5 domain-containing protein [Actinoplanes sp. LDG1-06]|uniref:G5 domain-containing protein n=2 Tax=Paractinoplanes ovalisporus TaxID=2810368 RepID=A0ABS2AFB5_9ACTN|nr:G5 domain-containing protein [Actinoplanes ovalisporus]
MWPGQPPRKKGFWQRLSPWQRAGVVAVALILPCCGGVTVIGALAGDKPKTENVSGDRLAEVQPIATTTAAGAPEAPVVTSAATGAPVATTQPEPEATTAPATTAVVTTKRMVVKERIPYQTRKVEDDSLAKGKTRVRTKGVAGVKTVTWETTYTDGKPTARRIVKTEVTRKPVTKVVAVGTKEAGGGNCDPNYSGCVPIASDVDCAGGSGNGPAYVDGPVTVIGDDIYDLDRDGDGIACDS